MHKFKLALFGFALAAGVAHASTPCNGFEIKIKNNTSDDLLVTKMQLSGADLQPGGVNVVKANTAQAFTVNNSADGGKMIGDFDFNSVSLPVKKATIKFQLKNKKLICHHDEKSVSGDYAISKTRLPGHVTYTIGK